MRIISLRESQYDRLFESVTDSDFGKSNVPEYDALDSVEVQPTITSKDGSPKKANPLTADKFQKQQTTQQWGFMGYRR